MFNKSPYIIKKLINNKKILTIIPARKGSKGLKNKNILNVNGKPLIYWPIAAAKKSKFIDEVTLSTDCKATKRLGKKFGANVPFLRPKNISKDDSTTFEVIKHSINFFSKQKIFFDYLLLLEPTSPLTTTKDIDYAIKHLLKNKKFDSVISVAENVTGHPKYSVKLNKEGKAIPIGKSLNLFRRQKLDKIYCYSGNFYFSKIKTLLKKKTFYHNKTLAIISEKFKAIEIDDYIDLLIADKVMKYKRY